MLTALSISNYALIKALQTDFSDGLSIITGETGAGKSILLGALGLVMGNRADLNSLKDSDKKCIIEATFSIKEYGLKDFFEQEDIDYEEETILRREILPSGKSRAFVNDTPVTLSVLNVLKSQLIDVHSQHKTAQLSENKYQFQIVDALANNETDLLLFKATLKTYKSLQKELEVLLQSQEAAKQEYAYNSHLFAELEEANFKEGEQQELEENLDKLNNIEVIKLALAESVALATNEQVGIQDSLNTLSHTLQKISSFSSEYENYLTRVESLKIELDDVVFELEKANENVDFDPNEIEEFNDRLQLLYSLQKKHMVSSIEELLAVKDRLDEKIGQVENSTEILEEKKKDILKIEEKLSKIASKLHASRKKAIPVLTKQLEEVLSKLGMSNASFKIQLEQTKEYFSNGFDQLNFLFAANKGTNYDELKKVASGGELSRIMLGVKLILSKYSKLPTIIFDEIDTGVSGDVSNKIADVMAEMGNFMQVITITHLPQIAAKGNNHYKVYKKDVAGVTNTFLKQLSAEERIKEVAEILGGKDLTASALEHAKELLKA
ncbi:DNA repair protein RecN [Flavicella sediminum]|uniref:DNA repair protein RecN n=1 Tax=Flavicella sediminum TaxID=2585141 RepID=UPI001123B245|nr:DNA repair protein RecN [Flavicella sediminum]